MARRKKYLASWDFVTQVGVACLLVAVAVAILRGTASDAAVGLAAYALWVVVERSRSKRERRFPGPPLGPH